MEHFIHEIDWKLIGEKMIMLKHTSLTKRCVKAMETRGHSKEMHTHAKEAEVPPGKVW